MLRGYPAVAPLFVIRGVNGHRAGLCLELTIRYGIGCAAHEPALLQTGSASSWSVRDFAS